MHRCDFSMLLSERFFWEFDRYIYILMHDHKIVHDSETQYEIIQTKYKYRYAWTASFKQSYILYVN